MKLEEMKTSVSLFFLSPSTNVMRKNIHTKTGEQMREEVRELVRKHAYRLLDEPRGQEMTSWRRGAQLCAGNPGVR